MRVLLLLLLPRMHRIGRVAMRWMRIMRFVFVEEVIVGSWGRSGRRTLAVLDRGLWSSLLLQR